MINAAQNRMGRAALNWTVVKLAQASGVSVATISRFERGDTGPTANNLASLRRAMEAAGVIFVDEDDGGGRGVRLQKAESRQTAAPKARKKPGGGA